MAATTARIDPTTEAAPLTAQAHATRPSLRVPAEAMTVGKTVPRGTPIAVATRHAAAPRARSGHARVPAATRSNASAARVTPSLPPADAADPPAAPTRSAASPSARASAG